MVITEFPPDEQELSGGEVIATVFAHQEQWGYAITDIEQTSGTIVVSVSHALDHDQLTHIGLKEMP
jgi:hypothetical protein